jgi:hypothetical protein
MNATAPHYEKYADLASRIFQIFLKHSRVKTTMIERNFTLKGKTADHNVDIVWTFEAGGTKYHTIVECKEWKRPVSLGAIRDFKQVLDDIPSQPRGIFVSSSGFQAGAITFALNNGIQLHELREPTDDDLVKIMAANGTSIQEASIKFKRIALKIDADWIRRECQRLDYPSDKVRMAPHKYVNRVRVFDGNGCALGSLQDILKSLRNTTGSLRRNGRSSEGRKPLDVETIEFQWNPDIDLFVRTRLKTIPRVRLLAISGEFERTDPRKLLVELRRIWPQGGVIIWHVNNIILGGEGLDLAILGSDEFIPRIDLHRQTKTRSR